VSEIYGIVRSENALSAPTITTTVMMMMMMMITTMMIRGSHLGIKGLVRHNVKKSVRVLYSFVSFVEIFDEIYV